MSRIRIWVYAACLVAVLISLLGAAPMAKAQSFSVVYNFWTAAGDPSQGFYSGIIAQGQDGNLYSGTSAGGAYGNAATFNVTPAGILASLYSFANNGDGALPFGGLTLGTDGDFYGTTYNGGFGNPRYGTVFKMTSSGGLTTLYAFADGNDGATPFLPLVESTDGNFYGTTSPWNGAAGSGAIYEITLSGTFTVLHQFDGTDGAIAAAPLTLGTDGNFYGTTIYGGPNGNGNVFRITPSGFFTVLYNLDNTLGDRGKPVKFTATLTSNGGLPNGQILTFTYNNTTLGTAKISGGKAIFSTTALPSGSDQVSASFAGTADYSSASDTVTKMVN